MFEIEIDPLTDSISSEMGLSWNHKVTDEIDQARNLSRSLSSLIQNKKRKKEKKKDYKLCDIPCLVQSCENKKKRKTKKPPCSDRKHHEQRTATTDHNDSHGE